MPHDEEHQKSPAERFKERNRGPLPFIALSDIPFGRFLGDLFISAFPPANLPGMNKGKANPQTVGQQAGGGPMLPATPPSGPVKPDLSSVFPELSSGFPSSFLPAASPFAQTPNAPTTRPEKFPDPATADDVSLAGRQAELLGKQEEGTITAAEQNELGRITEELRMRQSQQALQQQLILSILPALLSQGSQESQFAQTQALAEQRFAAEQALTQEQLAARQQEQQQADMARKTAAALIPQLFPDLDIDPAALANGIDPSILPVLITLARLRAEQGVAENRRSVVLPTFRFS